MTILENKEGQHAAPLRILHLEDDSNDAALVQAALEAGEVYATVTRVHDRDGYLAALEGGGFDLIFSDCALPAYDGMSALKAAHAKWPAIPLIFVSGTLGEERAIESLKSGATDYVLKENLARLAPAVRRAMQEVAARAACQRLEVQFVEAQKMEVVGQLAAGVAHDFNNVLGVIMGYSDLILLDLNPNEQLRRYTEFIRHAADRASGLTRQLLVFSRKQKVQPSVIDLNDVVKDLDKMLRRLMDENIEMIIIPGEEIGRIKADSGHVGQVLMNLVVNARDAMPNGGKLTITTNKITLDEAQVRTHSGTVAGDYVMLSVSDTGCGMTDEVKIHLFKAFFTTKPKGSGTGLGLATCQSIVHQSGGHIDVRSKVGHGTTFKIYFPRVEQPLDVVATAKPDEPLPRGTETLLVVEDDPSVRHLARGVLEGLGYVVLSAANGQDALRVAPEQAASPLRLVITDVIMPHMGGRVMTEWLRLRNPQLKVLFTSGYTDDALAERGVLEAGVEFLPKPYTLSTLARKVRAMLDGENERPK